jgi:type I restriction enzyme R subunit
MRPDLNESETRVERIDAQLARVGWRVPGVDFEEEYEVGSVGAPDHGFSDYALPAEDGSIQAIIEAKRSSRDAIAGKEQASLYAEAIEARTGRRPLVFLANGNEIWFWDHVSNPRLVAGFFTRDDLNRRRFQLENRE